MPRVDIGTVEVEVGEEVYTLTPTLKAMQKVEARYADVGGLSGIMNQAVRGTVPLGADELAFLIAAGAGLSQRQAKDLPEEVFQHGTIHIAPKCIEFLGSLAKPTRS